MGAANANRNAEMVQALIDGGANVNAKDKKGFSVLSYSKNNENKKINKLLVAAGAK